MEYRLVAQFFFAEMVLGILGNSDPANVVGRLPKYRTCPRKADVVKRARFTFKRFLAGPNGEP